MQASCKNLRPVSHVPPPSVSFSSAASESSLKLPFVSIPCRFHLVAGEMSLSRGSPWFPQQSSFISNAIFVIIIIITMFIITVSICIPKKKKIPCYFILFHFILFLRQRQRPKRITEEFVFEYADPAMQIWPRTFTGRWEPKQSERIFSFFLSTCLSVGLSFFMNRKNHKEAAMFFW